VCTADCSTNGGNRIRNSILTPYGNAANGRAIAKVFATNLINSANMSHRAIFESWFILLNPDQPATFRAIMRSKPLENRTSCTGIAGSCADSTRSLLARASDFRYHDGKLFLPAVCNGLRDWSEHSFEFAMEHCKPNDSSFQTVRSYL